MHIDAFTSSLPESSNPGNVGSWQWISARINTFVWSNYGFLTGSDRRIKKDIQDVIDSEALNMLRLVKPKTYKFIDRHPYTVYGFIAQDVEEIIPYATTTQTEYIPNIFDTCNCVTENNTNVIILNNKTLEHLEISDNTKLKIKLKDDLNKKDIYVTIKSIINNTSFSIEETINEGCYFAYGQEVNDFRTIDKESIYTIAVAALQDVDKQLQQTIIELNDTKSELAAIKAHLGL